VAFLYSVLLKLLYPTSVALVLMAAAVVLGRRPALRRTCEAAALAVLLICGNACVNNALLRRLEQQYPAPQPLPNADAIVVLSGGVLEHAPPRPTLEIADAGDRVLYAATLFRQGKARSIICTGGVATGAIARRPAAEDMAELLVSLMVPPTAIVTEGGSANTAQHARNLCPLFENRGIRSVLLVTSALHMPRSIGTFRKTCPAVGFVPAPTDFRVTNDPPAAWYRDLQGVLPTPRSLLDFSDAAHEYLGIAYYRIRGWY
jgi:uncharacterized SAM-binding protein YcdF (DUF218 family)